MQTITIQTSQNIDIEYELAGVGDRIVAYIIDVLIYAAYLILMGLLTNVFKANNDVLLFFLYLPILLYQLLCEIFLNGQSIGKRAKGIRVISLNGNQPDAGQYILRWLFRIIDTMVSSGICAVLTIALTEKGQRLGDIFAGTTVVRTRRTTRIQDTIFVYTDEDHQVKYPRVTELSDKDISLIREVLNRYDRRPDENLSLLVKTAQKVQQLTGIQGNLDAEYFLKDVITDYNYLTSK
jgi:uncharacterized RDD family membrane protein YckC